MSDLFEPFRGKLRKELPRWREEGLVDARAERILVERYRLDESGVGAGTMAIYLLGGLLVCGGVISFVAWNWESMPRAAKLLLLGGAMAAAHLSGSWLWKSRGFPRLGHALTFLGTLIFGANIGLVAQIFHVPSVDQAGYGLWALGALAAAWILRSVPAAAVAAVTGSVWSVPEAAVWTPWLLGVALAPLAFLERSRALYLLVGHAVVVNAMTGAWPSGEAPGAYASLLAVSALQLAWPFSGRGEALHGAARAMGILGVVAAAFPLSFRDVARDLLAETIRSRAWLLVTLPPALGAILFCARAPRRGAAVTWSALGAAALAGLSLLSGSATAIAAAANVALAGIAAACIRVSMHDLRRGAFWFGCLLAGALIAARFLEFETDLGVKAAVFVACGVAVILVGVRFERRLRRGA